MKIKIFFAILACKLTKQALRILKRGGTALPGKVALGICPNLLKHLAKDVRCAVITGTNGKTTSARMLEQFYKDSAMSYITNKSGSNLLRGIAAEFALNATLKGKPKRENAIIEFDEAASKKVFEQMNPAVVLVTNVFSDQLDRYGTIDSILENIKIGINNSPNAVICLNADDPLTSSIAMDIENEVAFFGIGRGLNENYIEEPSDAENCVRCKTVYEYDYRTYGHLGSFRCPSCGYARVRADVSVEEIIESGEDSQTIKLCTHGEEFIITINQPGGYNIYNAAGVITAAIALGFSKEAAKEAMAHFEGGFGRMEKFDLNGLPVRMILAKNTVGYNRTITYLCSLSGNALIALSLNDRIADGTDVSWIKDVHFEKLHELDKRLKGIFLSGTRARDLKDCLLRVGFNQDSIQMFDDQHAMIDAAVSQEAPVYIIPSYTAMLDIRSMLARKFGLKEYWEL